MAQQLTIGLRPDPTPSAPTGEARPGAVELILPVILRLVPPDADVAVYRLGVSPAAMPGTGR